MNLHIEIVSFYLTCSWSLSITLFGVAQGWLELLEPAKLSAQGVVCPQN